MKKLFSIVMISLLVSLCIANTGFASHGDPVANCPPNFELHHFMHDSDDSMHRHIGVNRDLNGDGYICMKMLPNDLHLHVDNSIPLR